MLKAILIDASAEYVWEILVNRFYEISGWASDIESSIEDFEPQTDK